MLWLKLIHVSYRCPEGYIPNILYLISKVCCQKGPTHHAYAWQIGPFWQDTLDIKEWLHPIIFCEMQLLNLQLQQ